MNPLLEAENHALLWEASYHLREVYCNTAINTESLVLTLETVYAQRNSIYGPNALQEWCKMALELTRIKPRDPNIYFLLCLKLLPLFYSNV